ncbi:hypothetical protein GCM10011585_32840 [Edaphobacter dinghuensis]|uniref:Uncharacterized protein n=2 Tax=Edaphobacter dinghuensis TaxID=1560005 RepID=A0A917HPJ7_9BACT|nr:hypothetical protein GCM10011585_32840 [Edaphobacter dinghuensis]
MSRILPFTSDDEDDSALFEKLRGYVLENYPNPERKGCFDRETLRTFVEDSSKLDLKDPRYLHIFKCAECTRELNELRAAHVAHAKNAHVRRARSVSSAWRLAASIVLVCLVGAVAFIGLKKAALLHRAPIVAEEAPVPVELDLSKDGDLRGAGQPDDGLSLELPRKRINLSVILPVLSPPGEYRFFISREKGGPELCGTQGLAVSLKARTEIHVQLDLHALAAGNYYLGSTFRPNSELHYYPVRVH